MSIDSTMGKQCAKKKVCANTINNYAYEAKFQKMKRMESENTCHCKKLVLLYTKMCLALLVLLTCDILCFLRFLVYWRTL